MEFKELWRQVRQEYEHQHSTRNDTSQQLPEEVEEGNVEYKLQLINKSEDRFKQLITQLHWRLNEGNGIAFYEVGVMDNGEAVGIDEQSMQKSLSTLYQMCRVLKADMNLARVRDGSQSKRKAVTIRVSRVAESKSRHQLRVSVIGDVASGKSTLIGAMTRGCFDDGNGLARMQIVRHRHEIENGGRTSSMSEHMVGVTEDGSFMSLDMIGECDQLEDDVEPECQRLITFSDLAGHKKYLKVTASGLASQFPDYAILVVDSGRGVQEMTKEHLKIVTALEVAVLVVMTKTDVATDERIQQSIKEVEELFGSFSPEKTICIMDDNTSEKEDDDRESSNVVNANANANAIALFKISNVSRTGFEVLQRYLSSLTPRRAWQSNDSIAEFQINHSYDIQDAGTIVTGLVQSGTLHVGDEMLLGPDGQGKFQKIHIENIQVQRKPVRSLFAGETGAILISFDGCPSSEKHVDKDDDDVPLLRASFIRKGMMLVHPSLSPMATLQFDAEIHFLKDSPTIRENYQAVIHAGPIRQMVKLVRMELNEILLATTKQDQLRAICRFEFLYWPEYIRPDLPLVLREGSAHAVGKVVRAVYHGFDCTEQRVVQRRVKQCC